MLHKGRINKAQEERMTLPGRRGKFGVELTRQKPRVLGDLDHLHEIILRRPPGNSKPRSL